MEVEIQKQSKSGIFVALSVQRQLMSTDTEPQEGKKIKDFGLEMLPSHTAMAHGTFLGAWNWRLDLQLVFELQPGNMYYKGKTLYFYF